MTTNEPTEIPMPPQRPGSSAAQIPPADLGAFSAPRPPVQPASRQLPLAQMPAPVTPSPAPSSGAEPAITEPMMVGTTASNVASYEASLGADGGTPHLANQTEAGQAATSKTGLRVGLLGTLLAITGLGGFAVKTALTEPAGPATPEAAMEAWFEAFANEDLLGMAEVLLPSEREAFIDPMFALSDEVERLEVFEAGTELATFGTIDVVVEGLAVSARPLADGFAVVEPTAGTLQLIGSSDDLPVAAVLSEWLEFEPTAVQEEVTDLAEGTREVVAVEQDGSWYLSLGYTVAEAARAETSAPLPVFGAGPIPVGGETPEAAVRSLVQEAVALDLEGVLTQLDPEEMRVLYDYAPLFLTDGQSEIDVALDDLRAEGVAWSVTDLQLSSDTSRGRTVVFVDGFTVELAVGEESLVATFNDGCSSVTAQGPTFGDINESFCAGDPGGWSEGLQTMAPGLEFPELPFVRSGLTVVERDGRWYVAAVPTVLYTYVDILKGLEPADITEIKTFVAELATGIFDPFSFSGFDQGLGGIDFDNPVEGFDIEEASLEDTIEEDGTTNLEDDSGTVTTGFVYLDPSVDPAYVPAGVNAFEGFVEGWWLIDVGGIKEPFDVFSVGDDGAWIEIAEYPTSDSAQAAMATLLLHDYVGNTNESVSPYGAVRRSGRFLVAFFEGNGNVELADSMAVHLEGL